MKTLQKRIGLVILLLLGSAALLPAQEFVGGFVADEFDPRAINSNPAILSFQDPMFISGMQIYHIGIVSKATTFRQTFFGISSPFAWGNMGIGAHVNNFQSPILRRTQLATTLAYRLFKKAALGLTLNAINFGYDLDAGTLVDPNDPVFAKGSSRTTLGLDVGLNLAFSPSFNLALGWQDINHPPLSLSDESVRTPRSFLAGAAFRVGMLRFLVETRVRDGEVQSKFSAELSSSDGKYLRMGYSPEKLAPNLDFQIALFGGFRLNYSYNLPFTRFGDQALQGSHSFALIYDFRRLQKIPQMPLVRTPVLGPKVVESLDRPEGEMLASVSKSQIHLIEREIIRSFDETVTREDLAHLSPADLGLTDLSMDLNIVTFARDTSVQVKNVEPMGTMTSPEYAETFRTISDLLREREKPKVYLVAPSPYLYRAEQVRQKYLDGQISPGQKVFIARPVFHSREDSLKFFSHLDPRSVKLFEHYLEARPDSITFQVFDGRFAEHGTEWRVEIRNSDGEIIKVLFGSGHQQRITWNLRDQRGRILQPGLYTYAVVWLDASGFEHRSPRRKLYVKKFKRTLNILVTKNPRKLEKVKSEDINVFFRK